MTTLSSANRARRVQDRAFDQQWGTDTSGGVGVHDLGFDPAIIDQCRRYDPSDAAMLREPVELLGIVPARCDFIDYGAGKGRMLMLAMQMGFKSVTGVELAGSLCEIARDNLQRFTARSGIQSDAAIVQADATSYTPAGAHIVAYFYNPFGAQIMREVQLQLERALAMETDCVTIIYANPEHHRIYADNPRWMPGPSLTGIATFTAEAAVFRA
ncbi:class I SAM-dependent methyltransferase [Sphingomonas xinjiangensis]|uniref:Putative RNA methylase n=1 Tax=Sphingomonas xinjiangensis TaxID=643568 RepID=A0A840YNZ5_9SPHN|nr:class I SAM-dependent methyltransferase [Sphingomonas xinjiangensis]MBB5709721.1 putative RNA methylase [Sphingomonas xinjiangensis]